MSDRPSGRARRRSGNPAVRAGAVPPSPARAEVERRSRPLLVRLAALPRWLVLLVVLTFVILGLALPAAVGGAILLALSALVAWLVVLSWPALGPGARTARILLLVLLVGYAVRKMVG